MARADAAQEMMKHQCEQEFRKYDTDNSGTIKFEELVPAMQAMHARCGLQEPNSDKVKKALSKFDKNSDGVLDFDEFMDLFAHIMLKANKPKLPPNLEAMKVKSLEIFDQIAPDGKLGKNEFVAITSSMIKPMFNMPLAMVGSGCGPMGPYGPEMLPALERAVEKFDMGGLNHLLSLIHAIVDKDNSGTIEKKEVKKFWDLLAIIQGMSSGRGDPNDLINVAFSVIDRNGDGAISLDEWTGIFENIIQIMGEFIAAGFEAVDRVVTSPEADKIAVSLVAMSPVMTMDANGDGVIQKEEFKKFMQQQHISEMVAGQLQMLAAMSEGKSELFEQMKNMRAEWGKQFGSFYKKLFASAASWAKGGVDEPTFLATVVPIYKEQMSKGAGNFKKLQQSAQQFGNAITQSSGFQWHALQNEEAVAQQKRMMEMFDKNPEIIAIQEKVQNKVMAKAGEYTPDLCRNIFRLLDLDKSGRISSRELNVLKALMDGFLRLGYSAIKGSDAENALTEEDEKQLKDMYPDLFKEGKEPTIVEEATALMLAVFDMVDRDGDGEITQEEMVGFVVNLASFMLTHMKIMTKVVVDSMVEMEKEMFKLLWSKLEITEVTKEQIPQIGAAIMMMVMTAMQPVEG